MDKKKMIERLLENYQGGRIIDQLETGKIDKVSMNALTDQLVSILYYGFYENDGEYGLANTINNCAYKLKKMIDHVAKYGENINSQQIVEAFFEKLPEVRDILDTDLEAIFDGDPAARNKEEIILAYPGFYAISVYRLAHELFLLNVPVIPRIMSEHAHSLTGIDIHPGATIGRYFFIDHGTGIVVGETTLIGEHVKLYQGVTLGALSTRGGQKLRGKRRHPSIGDNVTIYACAAILGDTIIGSNSTIGSNVFITEDIPEGTKVSINLKDLHKTVSY